MTAGDAGVSGTGPERSEPSEPAPDESELVAAFDRLQPQGSLRWGFDDAMRRIAHPETDEAVEPWPGLPEDLWERGRSARIGQRFVGDVAGVMAGLLAADSRATAAAAAARVNTATWDALRYLAARVEALEAAGDPAGLEAAELRVGPPDAAEWAGVVGSLLGPPDADQVVLVGECGEGSLLGALHDAGRTVEGVEPRGEAAWRAIGDGGRPGRTVVLAEVLEHLRRVPRDARSGTVLAGCVDRLGLAAKLALVDESIRVTRPGGPVVVVATDQSVWDGELDPPARDLAPGRPLHPETWSLLLGRCGLVDVTWHRPGTGRTHAVAALVPS